jgi:hypothetical protein
MKIEFEKITEKANTRKEVLQELQKLIGDAETYHNGLVELISWLQAMKSRYDLLDQEGRSLLPDKISTTLLLADHMISSLSTIRFEHSKGIFWLVPQEDE